MTPADRDLSERFATLRREEERGSPAFAAVWAAAEARRRPRQGRRVGWRLAAALGSAAFVALAVFGRGPHAPAPAAGPARIPPSITEWRAPTDFLLETPAREVLRSMPRFGREGPPSDRGRLALPTPSPTSHSARRRRES